MMTNLKIHRNLIASAFTAAILTAGTFSFASQEPVQVKSAEADRSINDIVSRTDTEAVPSQAPIPKGGAASTALVRVNAAPSQDGVVIHVEADGALKNYKSFTLTESPPRIVFDFPGLRSAYKGEQRMPVKTGPVSQVRHFAYPEKVRLVIETQKPYLATYTMEVVDNGILIQVGDAAVGSVGSKDKDLKLSSGPEPSPSPPPAPTAAAVAKPPAAVKPVEFAAVASKSSESAKPRAWKTEQAPAALPAGEPAAVKTAAADSTAMPPGVRAPETGVGGSSASSSSK